MKTEKYYAVYKNEDNEFELWSDVCNSRQAALTQGEIKVLDTYGSKSKKYTPHINGITTINDSEARYLKLI